jgi:hypothetical protein
MTKSLSNQSVVAAAIAAMLGDTQFVGKKFDDACAVFELADNASTSFAEKLAALGLDDRAAARPIAMAWASQKYAEPITKGQRGFSLEGGSAAYRAMHRVLDVCFPREEPFKAKESSDNADPVAKLLKSYGKLTGAQKRSFKAKLAAL